MNITINNARIEGEINAVEYAPMVQRYLVCQALTPAHAPLESANESLEILATIHCLKELGLSKDETGEDAPQEKNVYRLVCGTSGISCRYLLPLACALGKNCEFIMQESFMDESMAMFLKTMKVHGIRHEYISRRSMRIWGKLTAGTFLIPSSVNPQFVSGLLLALPLLKENSILMIDGKLLEEHEIRMTLQAIALSGVKIDAQINSGGFGSRSEAAIRQSKGAFIGATFKIAGNQEYHLPERPLAEGDWTIASCFLTAAALSGGPVSVKGLRTDSLQPEKKILDFLRLSGALVEEGEDQVRVLGPKTDPSNITSFFMHEKLRAIEVDVSETPRLIPMAALLATCGLGISCIRNLRGARAGFYGEQGYLTEKYGEISVQVQNIIDLFEASGILVWEADGNLYIEGDTGKEPLFGGYISSCQDDRLAMLEGISSCISSSPVTIACAEAVEKTYPDFFGKLMEMQTTNNSF